MSEPNLSLVFDHVTIDFAGRRLLRGGVEQALEPKAFAVLALLARAPGRVFSRDEILDAVWGHRHITPGVLNRAMTLLRHALGDDAQQPRYLHTVHSVGYRFDLPPGAVLATATAAVPEVAARPETPSPAVSTEALPPHRPGDKRFAFPHGALWLLPLLALLVFTGWKWWPREVPATAAPTSARSIAVLPLANASRDPNQQFFSDGLSDSLIDALSRFDGLSVIGRTSSFRFRDSNDGSKAIGAKLGVAYLINGSVQHVGDTVRISVELSATQDGHTVWTEHYDRPYRDLFALQDEIARAVATALEAKLPPSRIAALQDDHPPNGSIDAYNAYLRGMQSFYRQDMRKAVEDQSLATRLDPGYAAAWAQLSIAWALIGYDATGDDARAAFRHSRAAIDQALRLAPELGSAHAALGNLLLGSDFDWKGAITELHRGVQLAPDNGPNHGGYSRALAASGRLREALEERRRARAIDPLSASNHFLYSGLLIAAGHLDEAEKTLRIGQDLQPRAATPYWRAYIAILRNDAKTALEIAAQQPSSPWREVDIALAEQIGTNHAAANASLARVIGSGTWEKTSPYPIAQAYALRGNVDMTVEWLERTWARRDTRLHGLLYDPLLLRFRKDPRLIAFCARIGLPPPDTSQALSIDQIRALPAAKR